MSDRHGAVVGGADDTSARIRPRISRSSAVSASSGATGDSWRSSGLNSTPAKKNSLSLTNRAAERAAVVVEAQLGLDRLPSSSRGAK